MENFLARMSGIVGRVKRLRQQRGMTLLAIFRKLGNLFLHHERHLVWEAILTTPLSPSAWAEDEQFFVLGPENIDSEMTPQLLAFLGEYSSQVSEDIEGVRKGDRVFIVANETAYLHHVYIYLTNSRRGTRRDRKCFFPLETEDIPILGNAWTVPAAQGRGMFHRATNEQLRYLQKMGYARVVSYAEKNNPSNRAVASVGMRVCRELSSWIFLNWFVLQKIQEYTDISWRVFCSDFHGISFLLRSP